MKIEIGNATLYLGDCREILPTLPKIDAVVADPPYGIAHRRGTLGRRKRGLSSSATTLGTTGIHGDDKPFDPSPFFKWPCVLWGANYFRESLPSRGRWLVWDKVDGGGAGDFSEAEIGWSSVSGPTRIFRHMWMGVQRASQLWEKRRHPTEKPIALMAWSLSFVPDGLVLDPFMGSGTTGAACANLGRKFIGIEIEPIYFEIACERVKAAYAQQRLFA